MEEETMFTNSEMEKRSQWRFVEEEKEGCP